MNINHVQDLVERLRKEVLGKPSWIEDKQVFEYSAQTVETVAILKLVRAAQGLSALHLLCDAGLIVDLGAAIRSVNDCTEEVYFLFENYPEAPTAKAAQFLKGFFENTIDGYLDTETHQVPREKIRSAVVRVLKGAHDDATQKLLERIYKTFCGYIHANYVNIMEVYNGGADDFNLGGVPSKVVRQNWMQHVVLAANSVLMASAFTADKLGKTELHTEMVKLIV